VPNLVRIVVDDAASLLNAGMYDAGAVVQVQSCSSEAGTYADLTTAALVSGTTVYTVYDATPVGGSSTWYRIRYENSGGTVTSDWGTPFQVKEAETTTYASLTMFRAFIRNQGTIPDDDTDLELLALEAAAQAIDRECGRDFRLSSTVSEIRWYTAGRSTYDLSRYAVDTDDFSDVTGLAVAFDASGNGSYTTACTTFRPRPANALRQGLPYRSLLFDTGTVPPLNEDGIQITARWGWAAVPANVVNANLIQASRFLKRRDSPYGIAGSPEMGNEMRLLARVDPDVALMLRAYKIDWGYA